MGEPSLAFLGVDSDDEELYRRLLRAGEKGRAAFALNRSQDVRQVQESCARLTTLGLVREGSDGVLHPVPPAKAVEGLVETKVRRLRDDLEGQVAARDVVGSLINEHGGRAADTRAADTGDAIQHLEGMEAVRAVLDELTFFTWAESLTTNPTGVMSAENIAHARPLDERVLRRGVSMRTLLGAAALDDPTTMNYARELTAKGAQIRISHAPLERLIICDRSAALTPLDPSHTARGAVLIRESGLVSALVALFERMWSSAQELPAAEDAESDAAEALSHLERKVLKSLYTVDKDESGARDLGISVRTYRKHVATLMRRLDATNRVQVALLARERGWL
ncbi:LuxR C-terminal-related transcriptional regulator [Kitasatospora sp. NPDC056181]|uniref:LuxR C-terminal-related transcriptional regulator n=1 Tax=Kitasatospora sp. NPDC056181 TaxID=3345737 RepID=UPI0035DD7D68